MNNKLCLYLEIIDSIILKIKDGLLSKYNINNDIAETTDLAETQNTLVEEFKLVLKSEHHSQK